MYHARAAYSAHAAESAHGADSAHLHAHATLLPEEIKETDEETDLMLVRIIQPVSVILAVVGPSLFPILGFSLPFLDKIGDATALGSLDPVALVVLRDKIHHKLHIMPGGVPHAIAMGVTVGVPLVLGSGVGPLHLLDLLDGCSQITTNRC